MSEKKDKRFKINMSFEDAMKKIATTKVDNAIMIEGKGKKYIISDAAGKKVQFTQIVINEGNIDRFFITAIVTSRGIEPKDYSIMLPMHPNQKQLNTVLVSYPPISVPNGGILTISIESSTNQDFEVGSLYYKILN